LAEIFAVAVWPLSQVIIADASTICLGTDRYLLHAMFTDPPAAVASAPQKKGGLAAARENQIGFRAYCQ
jgi:hypothetical protein